ncbi:ATP-binding protein [Fructilactobacillus myrtifloralis]|uniref:ATP-binding protein n=1 Tax=Fructilactobacillus myrtifloralis TaxID=2940301 RepID=A0ABY5BQJ4_9LACO|nr:P-loop NTPase fold protein [Fructilactobacillus myrtifloralis]USS85312.1 ATP-binding protein [Fructilactobacillus myrtifloralis]
MNNSSKDESMKIDQIDTEPQAQKFAEEIAKAPKTYFLQGKWGSGKTEYLKQVEKILANDNFDIFELKFWEPKNKETFSKNLFNEIRPKFAKRIFRFKIFFVFFGVIGTCFLIFNGLKNTFFDYTVFFPHSWINFINNNHLFKRISLVLFLIFIISLIFLGSYKFLNDKNWFDIDKWYFQSSKKKLIKKSNKKVLVIDDFDRIDADNQKELYILFNEVHNEIAVIFVGDLNNIENIENNYLGKIIDQKISLPYSLSSKNITKNVISVIENTLLVPFNIHSLKKIFDNDNLTARDGNHFLSYVQSEFINYNKINRVQTDQQLLLIYLYLFHPDRYQLIVERKLPSDDQDDENLNSLINQILKKRKVTPEDFSKNPSVYFLNELATNHSNFELNEIIKDDGSKLDDFFAYDEDNHDNNKLDFNFYDEFLYYIRNMRNNEYKACQLILEKHAIKALNLNKALNLKIRYKPNKLIKTIFEKRKEFSGYLANDDSKLFADFNGIFTEASNSLDIKINNTKKLYCFRSCLNLNNINNIINVINVRDYFYELTNEISNIEFGTRDYDAELLIIKLGYRVDPLELKTIKIEPGENENIISKINIPFDKEVKFIEELKATEYKAFWDAYGVQLEKDSNGKKVLSGVNDSDLDFGYGKNKYKDHVLKSLLKINKKEKEI